MFPYPKLLATAKRLIDNTGRLVTFQALSARAVDGERPWLGSDDEIELATIVKATFVPATGGGFGQMIVDAELLKRSDFVALTSSDADLTNTSVIIDTNGDRYKVDWAQVLKPGDITVLYAFGVSL